MLKEQSISQSTKSSFSPFKLTWLLVIPLMMMVLPLNSLSYDSCLYALSKLFLTEKIDHT
jgi:hypothetical protein